MSRVCSIPETDSPASAWPQAGLESVPCCPICGGKPRSLAHGGLRDGFIERPYACAPGTWDLYRCDICGTGYLDPRPNEATISLAYARQTSVGPVAAPKPASGAGWRRFRTALRNAYLNRRYGYQLSPASRIHPRWLSARQRQRYDKYVAYLPFPGKGARLLEVGCGPGGVLLKLREAGWQVCGVEPDPKAAALAQAKGLEVRVGVLAEASLPEAEFDAVVLHHVIEHFHDPMAVLRQCRRVLKPGGTLSVSTPNFESEGHRVFGPAWFPLDPPRHLIFFSARSLRRALVAAGFEPEPDLVPRLDAQDVFRGSWRVRNRLDPRKRGAPLSWTEKVKSAWLAWRANRAARVKPELSEDLILRARRPAEVPAR